MALSITMLPSRLSLVSWQTKHVFPFRSFAVWHTKSLVSQSKARLALKLIICLHLPSSFDGVVPHADVDETDSEIAELTSIRSGGQRDAEVVQREKLPA